jgi:hypothetical protein
MPHVFCCPHTTYNGGAWFRYQGEGLVREFNSKPGAQLFLNGWALASARQQQAMDASSLVVEMQRGADVRQDASDWRRGKTRWVPCVLRGQWLPAEACKHCATAFKKQLGQLSLWLLPAIQL